MDLGTGASCQDGVRVTTYPRRTATADGDGDALPAATRRSAEWGRVRRRRARTTYGDDLQAAGSRWQAAGGRRQAAGGRRQAAGAE
ncbi:hypothetical protein [Kribbella sp. NPDC049584]|uniref:hypothetical protein n=1 Tax=Kribbella sp. NPDC049584 TaxID=3154833 RepID=UPI003421501B